MKKSKSPKKQILHLLKTNAHKRYYLREIARKADLNPGTVNRILKKLVSQKIVTRQKEGNRVYFSYIESTDNSNEHIDNLDNQTKKWLSENKKELIKFIQTLIQIPSVSGKDTEDRITEHLYYKAQEMELKAQVEYKDRRRPNLIVELNRPKLQEKNNFLFLGHLDTVGISDLSKWKYYPYSGHKAGGRIYGRGAIDMKAGLACEIFLLKMIKELEINIDVNPRLIFVSNEEGGSTSEPIFDVGMDYLINEGWVEGIGAIYGYGGSYNIGIGHRGVLRVKIETQGESVHTGSTKWQREEIGANAVTAMAEILIKMEKVKIPKIKHPSFKKHENVVTPGTMILHGGTAVSMVPDKCESVVEVRYLPGIDIQKVYQKLKDIAEKVAQKRDIKVDLKKFVEIDAVCLSPKNTLVQSVKSSVERIYEQPVTTRGYGPANESFKLIKMGIPTVVFGPHGARAHSVNEHVQIASLNKVLRTYLDILLSLSKNA